MEQGNEILRFVLDNRIVEIDFNQVDFPPSTTMLNFLRNIPGHKGTKEGCAEGDCGACTVVLGELEGEEIHYKAVDSCLLFLPAIHGKQLITVENLAVRNGKELILHPVQQAMVDNYGSQCGFCTPGIVMALFALYKSEIEITRNNVIEALAGNLCRCTGYDPIYKAAIQSCSNRQPDHFDHSEPGVVKMLKEIDSGNNGLEIQTHTQKYFLPKTLEQALKILSDNPSVRIINGATDVAIRQNKFHEYLPEILDISSLTELRGIFHINDGFYIGAGTSIEVLREFAGQNLPALMPMLEVFASWQIRNVATVGGNLGTTSPIGDMLPMFIALNAQIELVSLNGTRWINMDEFVTGYRKNCLKPDEIIKGLLIPNLRDGAIFKAEKVSTRRDLDISTLSLAMHLQMNGDNAIEEIVLAYGGMADRPKRAFNTENYLRGKPLSNGLIEQAKDFLETDFIPISDARAGAEYRMLAAKNLLVKMLST